MSSRQRVAELVEAGELLPVTVRGWKTPAYLWPEARRPRRMEARALLSPFDPIVWFRDRALRMFDFHYRISIYTPAAQRVARLLRAALPARRQPGRPGGSQSRPQGRACCGCSRPGRSRAWSSRKWLAQLAEQLAELAGWLDLGDVVLSGAGDLAPQLARCLG